MHPRQPRVSLLKTKDANEAIESSVSAVAVASTPERIQVQHIGGSDPSAVDKKPLFGGLFSRKTNVMNSTVVST